MLAVLAASDRGASSLIRYIGHASANVAVSIGASLSIWMIFVLSDSRE